MIINKRIFGKIQKKTKCQENLLKKLALREF